MKPSVSVLGIVALCLLSGCAAAGPDERIAPQTMLQIITNPVPAVVINDNVPLYYDDPKKGRRVRDTLHKGEKVIVWWLGEPLDGPQNVYSPRNYFGSVDGRHLKFPVNEQQLEAMLLKSLEAQSHPRVSPSGKSAGPSFTVVSAISGCKYFVAETPSGHSLVEEYLCSKPRRGDTGRGNLDQYNSVKVELDGVSCTAWVDNYMMSKGRALERQAEKCN